MVRLRNVIDTRTGQFHTEAIVNERSARWFVPAVLEDDEADEPDTTENE